MICNRSSSRSDGLGSRHLQCLITYSRSRTILQNLGAQYFAGEVHQLQNQEQPIWFDRRQMFPVADHDLGNADLACTGKRFMQNCVGLFPALLRLKEIWLVEKLRIDLV